MNYDRQHWIEKDLKQTIAQVKSVDAALVHRRTGSGEE